MFKWVNVLNGKIKFSGIDIFNQHPMSQEKDFKRKLFFTPSELFRYKLIPRTFTKNDEVYRLSKI